MNEQKGFLAALILVVGVAAGLMLKPFLPYVMGAAILAFVMRPLHLRLRPLIGFS
ncbi:MAG: hypothetical protein ABEK00_02740 [Candidatus Nanohaloarchaea archaeon]